MAGNRVVIGLPERYEKAKRHVARLERREKAIRDLLKSNPNARLLRKELSAILDGDDTELD